MLEFKCLPLVVWIKEKSCASLMPRNASLSVACVAAEMGRGRVWRLGIQDQFGQSAPYERLLELNGVTVENIVDVARKLTKK